MNTFKIIMFITWVFYAVSWSLNDITLIRPTSQNPAVVLANSDSETIIVELSVTDANGNLVKNLTAGDFNVLVDGEVSNILTVIETDVKYLLLVKLPSKDVGKYDLRVQAINSREAIENDAIEYTQTGKQNIDVVLVIDRSGSMAGQPLEDTKTAAKTFVDQMSLNDQIGVVSFADTASVDFPLTLITDNNVKDQAKIAIDNISAGGLTSIGGGLQKATEELVNKGRSGIPHFIILLSDGQENTPPYVVDVLPTVIQNNITVYTIGFGGVDDNLMSNIATQTGGQYLKAPSSQDLQDLYTTIAGKLTQKETIIKETISLNPGDTKKIPIPVDPSLTRVLFFFEWSDPNQQFDVILEDPNSNLIDSNTCFGSCIYTMGQTYIYYDIENPTPGIWNLIVTSQSGGEGSAGARTEKPSLNLEIAFTKPLYAPGEDIVAFVTITDAKTGQVIKGAVVDGIITLPNGIEEAVKFTDDGSNGDKIANDGVYTLVYNNTTIEGIYTLTVKAQGVYQQYDFIRTETVTTYVQSQARIFIPVKVVDFGAIDPQSQSGIRKYILIFNIGGSDLQVWDFVITGDNAADFTIIDNTCVDQNGNPISIKPNESCALEIEFKPQDYGDREATLSMQTNDSINPVYSIKLIGQGVVTTPIYIENVIFNPGCAPKPFTIDFNVVVTGGSGIYTYKWDFDGDGVFDEITDQATVSFTFTTEGTYTVKVRVEDTYNPNNYREAIMKVCVLGLPAIGIDKLTAAPIIGVAPLTVNFDIDARGGSGSYIYEWDFNNDGVIDSTEKNPTYTYTAPGTYIVKVTVRDAVDSNNEAVGTLEIVVVDKPNVINASITATPVSGEAPLDVSFTLQINGGNPPYNVEWDFGDGYIETQVIYGDTATITHRYTQPGVYYVTAQIYSSDSYGIGTIPVQVKLAITVTEPALETSLQNEGTEIGDNEGTSIGGCNSGSGLSGVIYVLIALVFTRVISKIRNHE